METRMQVLRGVIAKKKKALAAAPPGRLNICGQRFYHVTEASPACGRYIRAENTELIRQLAQKSYDSKVLGTAAAELKCLEAGRIYSGRVYEDVYEDMNLKRQKFVTPDILTDAMYISAWESRPYEKMGFKEGSPKYKTDKGEYVRSRAEVLYANELLKYNVPYLYEYPVTLKNGKTVHPDFMILKVKTRQDKFLEHLGMMDKIDYADAAVLKLNELAKAGILIGLNLICTMETARVPFDTEVIKIIIRENFL